MTGGLTLDDVLEIIRTSEGTEYGPCFARESWYNRHIRADGDGTIWYVYGPFESNMVPYRPTGDDKTADDWMEVL